MLKVVTNQKTPDGGFTRDYTCDFCEKDGIYRLIMPNGNVICKTCLNNMIHYIDIEILKRCNEDS